jgi:hypothetical protein
MPMNFVQRTYTDPVTQQKTQQIFRSTNPEYESPTAPQTDAQGQKYTEEAYNPQVAKTFVTGAALPGALQSGLGALAGLANGRPDIGATAGLGTAANAAGNLAANALEAYNPNSKAAAVGAGALSTAGSNFSDALNTEMMRTGSVGQGLLGGLGAGFEGMLTGGLNAVPGGTTLAKGIPSLLGGIASAIGSGDPSSILSGLGKGAMDMMQSPTLGKDFGNLFRGSNASDYAHGTWGQSLQNVDQNLSKEQLKEKAKKEQEEKERAEQEQAQGGQAQEGGAPQPNAQAGGQAPQSNAQEGGAQAPQTQFDQQDAALEGSPHAQAVGSPQEQGAQPAAQQAAADQQAGQQEAKPAISAEDMKHSQELNRQIEEGSGIAQHPNENPQDAATRLSNERSSAYKQQSIIARSRLSNALNHPDPESDEAHEQFDNAWASLTPQQRRIGLATMRPEDRLKAMHYLGDNDDRALGSEREEEAAFHFAPSLAHSRAETEVARPGTLAHEAVPEDFPLGVEGDLLDALTDEERAAPADTANRVNSRALEFAHKHGLFTEEEAQDHPLPEMIEHNEDLDNIRNRKAELRQIRDIDADSVGEQLANITDAETGRDMSLNKLNDPKLERYAQDLAIADDEEARQMLASKDFTEGLNEEEQALVKHRAREFQAAARLLPQESRDYEDRLHEARNMTEDNRNDDYIDELIERMERLPEGARQSEFRLMSPYVQNRLKVAFGDDPDIYNSMVGAARKRPPDEEYPEGEEEPIERNRTRFNDLNHLMAYTPYEPPNVDDDDDEAELTPEQHAQVKSEQRLLQLQAALNDEYDDEEPENFPNSPEFDRAISNTKFGKMLDRDYNKYLDTHKYMDFSEREKIRKLFNTIKRHAAAKHFININSANGERDIEEISPEVLEQELPGYVSPIKVAASIEHAPGMAENFPQHQDASNSGILDELNMPLEISPEDAGNEDKLRQLREQTARFNNARWAGLDGKTREDMLRERQEEIARTTGESKISPEDLMPSEYYHARRGEFTHLGEDISPQKYEELRQMAPTDVINPDRESVYTSPDHARYARTPHGFLKIRDRNGTEASADLKGIYRQYQALVDQGTPQAMAAAKNIYDMLPKSVRGFEKRLTPQEKQERLQAGYKEFNRRVRNANSQDELTQVKRTYADLLKKRNKAKGLPSDSVSDSERAYHDELLSNMDARSKILSDGALAPSHGVLGHLTNLMRQARLQAEAGFTE